MSLSVSAAWDETAATARRAGWRVFGLAFLFLSLPSALLRIASPLAGAAAPPGLWLLFLPLLIAFSLLGALAITHVALDSELHPGEALRRGIRRLPPLFGAALLVAAALLLLGLPLLVLLSGAIHYAGEDAMLAAWFGLLFAAWLLPTLFFWVRLLLMTPVAAVEPLGPYALLRRSWRLTRGHFWRLLGFVLAVAIVSLVVLAAGLALAGLLVTLTAERPEPGSLPLALILLFLALVQAVISGLFTIFVARLYAQQAGAG